jgi:hydroxymethylbilane synthase
MSRELLIGTRGSELALWQAKYVQDALEKRGVRSSLKIIKSDGEQNSITPLYEMGVVGIFTKALDSALLNKEVDIVVHSLKDVPTKPAEGLVIAAIPERGNPHDLLVYKDKLPEKEMPYIIATSSLRRAAQWLNKYPLHQTNPLRGNINSRMVKLFESDWDAAIFAKAGIDRIHLQVPNYQILDWMVPAPAQGALAVVVSECNPEIIQLFSDFNDPNTVIATNLERSFLRELMGGCSMPIGAYAQITDDSIHFKGIILTVNGEKKVEISLNGSRSEADLILKKAVEEIKKGDGEEILRSFHL